MVTAAGDLTMTHIEPDLWQTSSHALRALSWHVAAEATPTSFLLANAAVGFGATRQFYNDHDGIQAGKMVIGSIPIFGSGFTIFDGVFGLSTGRELGADRSTTPDESALSVASGALGLGFDLWGLKKFFGLLEYSDETLPSGGYLGSAWQYVRRPHAEFVRVKELQQNASTARPLDTNSTALSQSLKSIWDREKNAGFDVEALRTMVFKGKIPDSLAKTPTTLKMAKAMVKAQQELLGKNSMNDVTVVVAGHAGMPMEVVPWIKAGATVLTIDTLPPADTLLQTCLSDFLTPPERNRVRRATSGVKGDIVAWTHPARAFMPFTNHGSHHLLEYLGEQGILVVQSDKPENYIDPFLRRPSLRDQFNVLLHDTGLNAKTGKYFSQSRFLRAIYSTSLLIVRRVAKA